MSATTAFEPREPHVFAARGAEALVGDQAVADLVAAASESPNRRARLLLHRSPDDSLHEMVIALPATSCDRPHINFRSGKSFHVVRGAMAVILFSDDGRERYAVRLDAARGGAPFMIRLNVPRWHTIVPFTDPVVFVETIAGPFTGNRFADWAPTDMDSAEGRSFAETLRTLANGAR